MSCKTHDDALFHVITKRPVKLIRQELFVALGLLSGMGVFMLVLAYLDVGVDAGNLGRYLMGGVGGILLLVGLCWLLKLLFWDKQCKKITAYVDRAEITLIVRKITLDFCEIKGIQCNPPVSGKYDVIIVKHDPEARPMMIRFTKEAYGALATAFDRFLTKDITKDNITDCSIYFGEVLFLEKGKLYCQGRMPMPLSEVKAVELIPANRNSDAIILICSKKGIKYDISVLHRYTANPATLKTIIEICNMVENPSIAM